MDAKVFFQRRERISANTTNDTHRLGRSAKQLARTSASRMKCPPVTNRLAQFTKLTTIENACKMMRADLLVHLIDEDGLRPIDIARVTGLRQSDLSQMYQTAKSFPPGFRPDGIAYNYLLLASRMVRKFPALRMQPLKALNHIRQMGLSQHRDVSRSFSEMARATLSKRLPNRLSLDTIDAVADRVHHSRFQKLLHRIPDGIAKIIHVDPPYIYQNLPDGRYRSANARSRACDNDLSINSIALAIDLLRDWQPKLARGGVLLLWQASGLLNRSIAGAIEENGWLVDRPIIWDKGRVQPGRFDSPYSTQTEMLWVLSRASDKLINHDGSSRSDILRFPPVSQPGEIDQQHCFEKPQMLCEFLIRKHSHPGELVMDLCNCTGSMTLAAIDSNRRWIYVESNRENFKLGAGRIAQRLGQEHLQAS